MDYICNPQLKKKSCDVIYQYQFIMRSELFVQQRQEILDELLPLITDLKNKKFPMIQSANDLRIVKKKAGKMYKAIDLD